MSYQIRFSLVCMLSLTLLSGCGGGDSGGPSLAEQVDKAMQTSAPDIRSRQLIEIAKKQKKAADTIGAEKTLGSAATAAGQIADAADKASMLNAVAAAQADLGAAGASDTVKAARKAADEIAEAQKKIPAYVGVAETYMKLDNADAANAYMEMAEEFVAEVAEPKYAVDMLVAIASGYAAGGQDEPFNRIMTDAETKAQALESKRDAADALTEIAGANQRLAKQFSTSDTPDKATAFTDKSKSLLAASETIAAGIEDKLSKAYAVKNIASKYASGGEAGKARKLYDEVEDIALAVGDASMTSTLMDEINKARMNLK